MREIGKSSVGVSRVTEYFDSNFENFYQTQIYCLNFFNLKYSSNIHTFPYQNSETIREIFLEYKGKSE